MASMQCYEGYAFNIPGHVGQKPIETEMAQPGFFGV